MKGVQIRIKSEFLKRTNQIGSKFIFDSKYIFSIVFQIAYTNLKGFGEKKMFANHINNQGL